MPLVEATYELLRMTKPFVRWRLPEADDISFSIIRNPSNRGEFYMSAQGVPTLAVNEHYHHTLHELTKTVAHEMCHLYEHLHGRRRDVHHGAWFNSAADKVCRVHGFDRGAF